MGRRVQLSRTNCENRIRTEPFDIVDLTKRFVFLLKTVASRAFILEDSEC